MIKIENADVWGFEHGIRGTRNPKNSWAKSDTIFSENKDDFIVGSNDLQLMQTLVKSGSEHRKFMRQIFVSADITAPLYWWKEADQYKVGTTTDSCSTMHKIAAKEFELDDFSWEQLLNTGCDLIEYTWQNGLFKKMVQPLQLLTDFIIPSLNVCREKYIETKDKKYWWQLIQLLPSSYNQRRTWTGSYENLYNMYHQRKNHKLDEWKDFCKWIESLPYAKELIVGETDEQSKET